MTCLLQTFIFLTIFCLNDLLIDLNGIVPDSVAVTSFSKWDPAQFRMQRLELVEVSRVLLNLITHQMEAKNSS